MLDPRNMLAYGAATAVLALGALAVWQRAEIADGRAALATQSAAYAEAMRMAAAAHARASEDARKEEARREAAKQEEINHAQEQRRAALAAADRADRAAVGLRGQLAAYVSAARANSAAADPAAAGRVETAAPPVVVLADLFGRADALAGELAKAVDAAHGAGLSCERSTDALTP